MSIPAYRMAGRLMCFPQLDGAAAGVPIYAVGWRIIDAPDIWTNRFLGFKAGMRNDLVGAAYIYREAVKEILAERSLAVEAVALTIALSSGNTRFDEKAPLYQVGSWVARQLGIRWIVDHFEKQAHRALHGIDGATARDAEVNGKYACLRAPPAGTVIVLDDLATRGATVSEIGRAIEVVSPEADVIGLVLGKNERASYAAAHGVVLTNGHVPAEWDLLWRKHSTRSGT